MSSFVLVGLEHQQFEPLFDFTDEQLREVGATRCTATHSPGFPCRVSMQDAEPGDELVLLPFTHHDTDSPYQASGPIFVRREVTRPQLQAGEIPPYVSTRLMSLRAYDESHAMIDALVCEGSDVGEHLEQLFDNEKIQYVQLHNAKRGCFSCQANRVTAS